VSVVFILKALERILQKRAEGSARAGDRKHRKTIDLYFRSCRARSDFVGQGVSSQFVFKRGGRLFVSDRIQYRILDSFDSTQIAPSARFLGVLAGYGTVPLEQWSI
jgi:hypothetical protein